MDKSRLRILIIAQCLLLIMGIISFIWDTQINLSEGIVVVISLFSIGELIRLYKKQ